MSTRFQTGTVRAVGKMWYGRYRRDVAGQQKRSHLAVVLGSKSEMTKQQAKKNGLTVPAVPALIFNAVADLWELKRLPQLKESSQYLVPILARKYLRPFFGALPLESIKTGIVNDWIAGLRKLGRHPRPSTICGSNFGPS